MSLDKFVAASGILHIPIVDEHGTDTGRSLDFNPVDQSFAEDVYGLASKIEKIQKERAEERETAGDGAARFDINQAEDKEIRAAVDSLFGEGFSNDVFKTRMLAVTDGLTAVENFLIFLLDKIDESIAANTAARDTRIKKYTDKYSKYTSKYHK